jgi:homogentisate 1,2-dioxygenase
MFETRMPIRTTAWAEQTPLMQLDYDDCWTGFEKGKV